MKYDNEDATTDVSAIAVNINDGGMKAIIYLDRQEVRKIVDQVKKNNGQLDHTTAMAIASSVAAAVKALDNENWQTLRGMAHKSNNREYDFEEEDDPRTLFGPNEEE